MQNISEKMRWMAFWAAVCVVLIHSTAVLTVSNPARWNVFLQFFITRSFTGWAVPFFFAVSGFWFAKSRYVTGGTESVWTFWRKKVKTLLLPYVIWIVLGAALSLPLILGNNFLTHRPLVERSFLALNGPWEMVSALFGLDRFLPMGNGPLWFLKQLILIFMLAPLWRLIARFRWGALGLLCFYIFTNFCLTFEVPVVRLGGMWMGWFALGMFVALKNYEQVRLSKSVIFVAGLVWVFASTTKALHAISVCFMPNFLDGLVLSLLPLSGSVFLWGVFDKVTREGAVPPILKETFFVYCINEILASYFMSGCKFIFGKSDPATLVIMVIAFVIAVVGSFGLAWFVNHKFPKFHALLTGGRGA